MYHETREKKKRKSGYFRLMRGMKSREKEKEPFSESFITDRRLWKGGLHKA